MKQALLDTDSVSYFFRGIPQVVNKVDEYLMNHGFVGISVVTYYEVMRLIMSFYPVAGYGEKLNHH